MLQFYASMLDSCFFSLFYVDICFLGVERDDVLTLRSSYAFPSFQVQFLMISLQQQACIGSGSNLLPLDHSDKNPVFSFNACLSITFGCSNS